MDYNTFRYTVCANCDKRFKDDCGDIFCSSSCEKLYTMNDDDVDKEDYCPRCGKLELLQALSRVDNDTMICNACGVEEAFEDLC